MASMNNDLQNPDFSNEFPIYVLTNKIGFCNTKTFCNTILYSYLGHEFKLFLMLWKRNWAFETGVSTSHKPCSKFSLSKHPGTSAETGNCKGTFRETAATLGHSM